MSTLKDDPDTSYAISDVEFVQQAHQLRRLKNLLCRNSRADSEVNNIALDELNIISYSKNGRRPTVKEWDKLSDILSRLSAATPDDLRRKSQLIFAPSFLYWLPLVLGVIAGLSLAIAVFPPKWDPPIATATGNHGWQLFAFMFWLVSLGSIGSIAFLYVNVLSIQLDSSIDISNRGIIIMRIILGSLFGVIISLPIANQDFITFCNNLSNTNNDPSVDQPGSGILLLLPFLLGFSTPLVLSIMNRGIESIQTFFGISLSPTSHPTHELPIPKPDSNSENSPLNKDIQR